MENRYAITLDFKQKPIFNVNFVQGNINTSVLEFRIVDGGQSVDISNQEVTVAFYKPDGTLVIQDGLTGVTVLDAPAGKLQCVLGSNTLAVVGIVKGEVNFDSDGTKLSTAQFIFNVTSSLDNGDILMSINELPKLNAKLIEIQSQYNTNKAIWDAAVEGKLSEADAKMAEEDAKIMDIQAQYNDDSTQWNSAVNNKLAEATVKIAETETARQGAITAAETAMTATTATNAAIALANQTSETTRMNWLAPVATFAALATTYPAAVKGDCAQVTGENKWYKYSGTTWEYRGDFSLTGYESIANVLSEAAYQAKFRQSQMHSGCITLPVITGGVSTLNQVTIPAADYNINGYIVSMPQTVVTLDVPPTTGVREDLIFLEAYFPSTDPYKMVGRYRGVAGVDFNTYPEGLGTRTGTSPLVMPQGGNSQPITPSYNWDINYFYRNKLLNSGLDTLQIGFENDVGLYVAGRGTATSKTTLQTYDGYSYAIPIARIKRRNTGGYSPSNPGGAKGSIFTTVIFDSSKWTSLGQTFQIVTQTGYTTTGLQSGDILQSPTTATKFLKIVSVDSPTQLTATSLSNPSIWGNGIPIGLSLASDHPQSLYSNVIDARDITDLRHRTQVQYNYDYELRKGSDQFMRGEIGSSKKMMKVYHGIPKSEIDEHTVFYASLDGTTVPEFPVGSSAMNLGTGSFKPMPTGSGYKFSGDSSGISDVPNLTPNGGSIDSWVNFDELFSGGIDQFIIQLTNANGYRSLQLDYYNENKTIRCLTVTTEGVGASIVATTGISSYKGINHIRVTWKLSESLKIYINGILRVTVPYVIATLTPTKVIIGAGRSTAGNSDFITRLKVNISDVHISNINRGSLFPNLPPDFISGDAIIMPKFTNQRRILSEAQMTQTVNGIAKINNADGTTRGIKTSRTSGNWTTGDTITVTGMAGELISGVFDADTALATVLYDSSLMSSYQSYDATHATIKVNNVSAFAVNDVVSIFKASNGTFSTGKIITAIDTTKSTITLNALDVSIYADGSLIVETTAASSYPLVKSSAGTVAGTWTPNTLGTNQATFTLGTNASLTNQDIQIDYSIIMPAGQPALTAPTTTTLQGEAGIRIPSSLQTITSDFTNKISGSTWSNPNVVKVESAIVANNPAPSAFTIEPVDSEYGQLTTQNGTIFTFETSVNGEQACVLLSFDLIKIAERKLGCKIPAKDKAGKVAWLRNNLYQLKCNVGLFGSSPTGNNASITSWYNYSSVWNSAIVATINNTITLKYWSTALINIKGTIDSSGFVHFLAYADPSDGITPSVINVDYASLDIKFSDKVLNSYKLVTGSTVHIRDDFAGKTSGDVVGCPNVSRSNNGQTGWTTLRVPSDGAEASSGAYIVISTADANIQPISVSDSGGMAQQRFSFNLIRIYEDKYGPIPAIDKVQWLKDNLTTNGITPSWWGYGSCPTGNIARVGIWNSSNSTWIILGGTVTTGSVGKVTTGGLVTSAVIDSSGFVHMICYSDPSDGVTPSTIYTDYCNIEVTLKTPTGYDILVPENPTRDAGMSQILFVRKETKEVQTLAGRDTDLNLVTYSEYLPAPEPISANTDVTILAEIPEFLITDLGSAVGYKQGTHHWMNPAYRVGQDKDELYGELGFSSVPFAPDSVGINVGAKINVVGTGFNSKFTPIKALSVVSKPLVAMARWLILQSGELKLLVYGYYKTNGQFSVGLDPTCTLFIIPLQGKPLSKEPDGIYRDYMLPTTWRTNPLVPQGFVDKATGKLITTGNSI